MTRILRSFARSDRAAVSIEFVLMVSFFMFFLLTALGAFDYFRAKRRAVLVADTVADLVSRTIAMNDAERDLVFAAGEAVFDRYAFFTEISLAVHSVEEDGSGDPQVIWSEANASSMVRAEGSKITDVAFPEIPSGETAIFAEVRFVYESAVVSFLDRPINFYQFSIRRPRYTTVIGYSD